MKKLLILDANSIVNRGFYAVRPLTNKDGLNTNAIFGFLNIFFKYVEEIKPDYIAAAFDVSTPTFRHKMYDGYKATRHKMPDELREQIPVLKDVLSAMNIPILELAGYEADDIIGTVSRICEEQDINCCVLTGDRDDLQLASEKTHIHLIITRMGNTETTVYDNEKVFEKYGVTPSEFIDLKAIMGDSSDNIPGVKGIGEKGATALISAFHSIEGVYENIEDASITKSVRTKLTESKDDCFMSKVLATIDRNVPIDIDIEKTAVVPYDEPKLYEILSMLEFKSFIKKMGLDSEKEKAMSEGFETVCENISGDKLKEILNKENVSFYYDKMSEKIAFCVDERKSYIADFSENKEEITAFLKGDNKKRTHGLKDLIAQMSKCGIEVKNVDFDTEIGAYLIEPSRKSYDLEGLCADYLGVMLSDTASEGDQLSLDAMLDNTNDMDLGNYAVAVLKLSYCQQEIMESRNTLELFNTIEMPLVYVLASMEKEGIAVDVEKLTEFGEMLKGEQKKLTDEIYGYAGHEFNINSPKQLATVLFEELELKAVKKTKSGYSTNAEVLEKLKWAHPIVEKILEYRKITKLNSTYVEGLLPEIADDGKIHSSFNQTVTVTGRISSTEPNLQNIPVRTELGREMRKMFIAKSDDYVLIDADYSQIELRVLAHIANDSHMIESFRSDYDIHSATAAKVFGVEKDNVTTEMRSAAKAINFGLVYGMGEFSLSQDLHISVKKAKEYIEDYLGSYPNVQKYMKDTVEFAKENGYVTTMFGRRRDIPEIKASNFQTRAFGERVALNTPVQGTAADIIKLAMINVYNRLNAEKLIAKLILQVHDELIIESPKGEVEAVCSLLCEEMEKAASLSVPLKVDMKVGRSWYDTK